MSIDDATPAEWDASWKAMSKKKEALERAPDLQQHKPYFNTPKHKEEAELTYEEWLARHGSGKSDGSSADYYILPELAKQLQDLISFKNMNAQIGEVFRECYRYGQASHSDQMRGAKKIRFYIEAEITRLENLNATRY